MRLGIMQPYFFPYAGYFELIHYVDRWILFDTPQYIRRGWVNRNRILHPRQGWQYVGVPVQKHSRSTPIRQIQISRQQNWRARILAQLDHYRRHAPYFQATRALVQRCLDTTTSSLARLNGHILDCVCQHLGIPFQVEYLSDMSLDLQGVHGPGQWAWQIARQLKATEYVNPAGGASLFAARQFAEAGMRLTIRDVPPLAYDCGPYQLVPRLSIIDTLMWVDVAQLQHWLRQQKQEKTECLPAAAL